MSPTTLLPHGSTTVYPTIRLGELLHQYQLGLVLIAGVSEETTEQVAESPVQWVHVSELEDPTLFLPPRTVLLTTGARFTRLRGQPAADAYVQRLLDAGVTALGIAVGLHWDRLPARFVSACDRLGLPLFRVPYDTAFIEIVQTAARLLDAQSRERDLWALDAQRAVTRASLHRDGLGAAIREAAGKLGRWVGITDRAGRLTEFAPHEARADANPDRIRREARRLIDRGVNAGRIGEEGEETGMLLQLLGRENRALGVLVVEDHGNQDTAERALLGLVAALATVQLEHRSGLDAAEQGLRTAIVDLLLAGDTALAERLSRGVLQYLPKDPVTVVRLAEAVLADTEFSEELESYDAASPGLFRAMRDGLPIIVSELRHVAGLKRLLHTHEITAGCSQRGTLDNLTGLLTQADRALEFAEEAEAEGPVDYEPALHDGVIRLLHGDDEAIRRSQTLLAPVTQHDARHGDNVLECLETWLGHHGQTSPAAAELGLHRHTLKTKVHTAATLLQLDIDSPDTRAELWTALRLTTPAEKPGL